MGHKFILGLPNSPRTIILDEQQGKEESYYSLAQGMSPATDHDNAFSKMKRKVEQKVAKQLRNAAFASWRAKLSEGEKLPRGKYFNGKKPGVPFIIEDEFWFY